MLSIATVTAWLGAKALGAKAAVTRFANGQGAIAIAVALAVVVVLVSGAWLVKRSESSAVDAAIGALQSKLATSRLVAVLRSRAVQREADDRAAVERERLVEQIRETATYAASLERELAKLTDNPVVFPEAIAKELRK